MQIIRHLNCVVVVTFNAQLSKVGGRGVGSDLEGKALVVIHLLCLSAVPYHWRGIQPTGDLNAGQDVIITSVRRPLFA